MTEQELYDFENGIDRKQAEYERYNEYDDVSDEEAEAAYDRMQARAYAALEYRDVLEMEGLR